MKEQKKYLRVIEAVARRCSVKKMVFKTSLYEICKNLLLTEHLWATASGVTSNIEFPFNNFVFIICLQKQNILYIFLRLLAIIYYRKDEVFFMVGKCINHIN